MTSDPLDDWIDRAVESDPLDEDIDLDEIVGAGPPLSAHEIDDARLTLARWHDPENFKQVVDALCARCKSRDWFNSPRLKFLHDAFVLARLAKRGGADQVRLAEATARWPDGFVRIGDHVHNIEVTSTHGGRKLGKEYKEPQGQKMDPVENWFERAESIPHFLDEAVNLKREKRYSAPCWLVVYLNISEYGIRQRETEAVIENIKQRYREDFERISILWKGRLY